MLCCCNDAQLTALITVGVSMVICSLLWNRHIFAPLKLVVVFLHEISHALAAVCTGGRVSGIEVNENYGGVTLTRGGNRAVTLTAGYIGSVFWGCLFLMLAPGRVSVRVGAVLFIAACILTPLILRIKNKTLCGCRIGVQIVLSVCIWGVGALVVAFWVIEDKIDLKFSLLQVSLMVIGTLCVCHALYDVLHDTLFRKIDDSHQGKSDAVMLAEEVMGTARCWGVIWSLISLAALTGTLFWLVAIKSDC